MASTSDEHENGGVFGRYFFASTGGARRDFLLCERSITLHAGTTGLTTWAASCVLANFLLQRCEPTEAA